MNSQINILKVIAYDLTSFYHIFRVIFFQLEFRKQWWINCLKLTQKCASSTHINSISKVQSISVQCFNISVCKVIVWYSYRLIVVVVGFSCTGYIMCRMIIPLGIYLNGNNLIDSIQRLNRAEFIITRIIAQINLAFFGVWSDNLFTEQKTNRETNKKNTPPSENKWNNEYWWCQIVRLTNNMQSTDYSGPSGLYVDRHTCTCSLFLEWTAYKYKM